MRSAEAALVQCREKREKLEKGVLPKIGVKVAQLIGENKQAILDKLRLEQRVTEAVDGMLWWPTTHNDPRIEGPQPRLVTREQYERLMKMREEHGEGDTPSAVFRDK